MPGKAAVDTTQDRMAVPVQDIQSAVEEDQAVMVMGPEAGGVASVLEPETENTQGSSSAESGEEAVGGEVVRGEGLVKGEVAVGQGSLIGRVDIRHGLDKTMVEAHDGTAPSESVPEEEDVRGKTDYMKVGRGERVGKEVEGDRFGVRLDRHCAGNVRKVCLSMSNLSGGVCEKDGARHGDFDRRLSGVVIVVEASAMVVGVDGRNPAHMNMIRASGVIGDVAVGAAVKIEDVGVVAENEVFDERRKELRLRLSWSGSNPLGEVDNWAKGTQKKQECSPKEQEVPGQNRDRREEESGRKNLDP